MTNCQNRSIQQRCSVLLIVLSLAGGLAMPASTPLLAATAVQAEQSAADGKVYVAFRMREWSVKHLHGAEESKQFLDTLKSLKCEVKSAEHAGHVDAQYRTVIWKLLAMDNHEQADAWVNWLKAAGFETLHAHGAGQKHEPQLGEAHAEVVQYRLSDWRTEHSNKAADAAQRKIILQGLGCEVTMEKHAGHTDLRFRCPQWLQIELPNHDAAHAWQQYLNQAGFETKHEH